VVPGIACGGVAHVRRWLARGFRFLAVNSDTGLLTQAASEVLAASREAAASSGPANEAQRAAT
jgi:2-keto-3-deoxy-L-rhamnonate aldolase RhmA